MTQKCENTIATNYESKHEVDKTKIFFLSSTALYLFNLQNDAELVSCYYSASHTDNLSTDEHDSVRETQTTSSNNTRSLLLMKSLQTSDSGADLSEYFKKSELETSWQKYWALNGERMIWNSWIAKYSDYINPDFIQESNNVATTSSSSTTSAVNVTIIQKQIITVGDTTSARKTEFPFPLESNGKNGKSPQHFLLRELSGCSDSNDKLNGEISEGWNPLSPLSVDCEFEVERLITSRCGSHASSSLRTVDSLTNVTRMTVSSIDLSHSSKTSSSPVEISVISSTQSSLTSSTNSDEEDEDREDGKQVDAQDNYDQQWNVLWKNHYEEEYMKNYREFILNVGRKEQDDSDVEDLVKIRHRMRKCQLNENKIARDSSRDSKMKEENNESSKDSSSLSSCDDENDDYEQMSSMGLPLAFGTSKNSVKVKNSAKKSS